MVLYRRGHWEHCEIQKQNQNQIKCLDSKEMYPRDTVEIVENYWRTRRNLDICFYAKFWFLVSTSFFSALMYKTNRKSHAWADDLLHVYTWAGETITYRWNRSINRGQWTVFFIFYLLNGCLLGEGDFWINCPIIISHSKKKCVFVLFSSSFRKNCGVDQEKEPTKQKKKRKRGRRNRLACEIKVHIKKKQITAVIQQISILS